MKREIKFRAWNTEFKKFLKRDSYLVAIQCFLASDDGLEIGKSDLENVVWMQFTGLHDKNGKEIYEGDVGHFGEESSNLLYKVVWHKSGFFFTSPEDLGKVMHQCHILNKDFCGVGNIYENPELI